MSIDKINSTKTVLVLGALYQLRKNDPRIGLGTIENIKNLVDIRIKDGNERKWHHLNFTITKGDIEKIIEVFSENAMLSWHRKGDIETIFLSTDNDFIGNPSGLHRIIPIELIVHEELILQGIKMD
jgi:hypothetical protein